MLSQLMSVRLMLKGGLEPIDGKGPEVDTSVAIAAHNSSAVRGARRTPYDATGEYGVNVSPHTDKELPDGYALILPR
jgi:hypothetical protein